MTSLNIGITSAPERHHHIIQQVVKGHEGVHNIADDTIIHRLSVEVHDKGLLKAIETLTVKVLTLNPKKSEFCIPMISFMGHVLSQKCTGPTEEKVRDVV